MSRYNHWLEDDGDDVVTFEKFKPKQKNKQKNVQKHAHNKRNQEKRNEKRKFLNEDDKPNER